MRYLNLVFFFLLVGPAYGQTGSSLETLNEVIRNKSTYDKVREDRITGYNAQLGAKSISPEEQFRVLSRLCEEYKTYQYDSAFNVARLLQRLAYNTGDAVKICYSTNQLGFVLLSSGLFKETLDSLRNMSMVGMPDSIRVDYYLIMARTNYDLGDYNRDTYFAQKYLQLGNSYIDSAISLCPGQSYNHVYFRSLRNIKNENKSDAANDLIELLSRKELTSHQIAITASTLAFYYIAREQQDRAIELLARAAIEDIKTATKETTAISNLAELLYNKGDILPAYKYIQEAMEDATFYGARQRKAQVGSILPLIATAHLNNVEGQRKLWLTYSTLITALTVLALIFALIFFNQLKKRKVAEKALLESNRIKEEYIGYYFNVNSDYVNKIENFKRAIEMKLMTRKVDDIRLTLDNLNMKKEREDLYTSFDRIFLKLFPDFVVVFNSYFAEADKIQLKEGQLMNTELRIFALIRMGIHDTEKIARILDYSINTIYNYRARVKGRSLIANEEFEKKIMEIHA
jgi:DNA-binding CsgD family transcriptional regulator